MPRRDWLSLVIALLAILVALLDHFHGYEVYLLDLNTHERLLPAALPRVTPTMAPLARKVTVVFVDGLGFHASLALPTLQARRKDAVWRQLLVEFPSYTYPGIVAYATGVPPRYSGLRLNHAGHLAHLTEHAPLPTLLQEAARVGLSVRIHNGDWPEFGDLLDFPKHAARVSLVQLLRPSSPGLDWLYVGEVDAAGHKHGGDSDEYREAALQADALVAKVLAATNLNRDAVVVLSDHGHLSQGGHGGVEPEVSHAMLFAIGAGITPIVEAPARSYLDVTPTIAALLATAIPPSSMGRVMLDALDASPTTKRALLAENLRQRLALEEALTPGAHNALAAQLLARLSRGEAALAPTEALLDNLTARRDAAFEVERARRSLARMPWAVGFTVLLVVFLGVGHLRGGLTLKAQDLLPVLIYTVIYMALYWVAGYRVSWSLPRGEVGFMLETFLFGGFAAAIALWSSKRKRWLRLREETLAMTLCFGLPYLYVAVWLGLDPIYLGGPALSFWLIFLVTIGFYAHGPFGVWLLIRSLSRKKPPAEATP